MNKKFSKSYISPLDLTLRLFCVKLLLARHYLFYVCGGQFHQSHQLAWQKANCSKYHCTNEPMSWKNVSTFTVRREPCEACLYDRIAVKKPPLRKQKKSQKVKVGQRQESSGRKPFGLTNLGSKSFGQIGGSICSEELEKLFNPFIKLCNPFTKLCNPFIKFCNPFIKFCNPFIKFCNPFIKFCNLFIKLCAY